MPELSCSKNGYQPMLEKGGCCIGTKDGSRIDRWRVNERRRKNHEKKKKANAGESRKVKKTTSQSKRREDSSKRVAPWSPRLAGGGGSGKKSGGKVNLKGGKEGVMDMAGNAIS